MHICVDCKKEMRCVKTGIVCIWNKTHCYSGDKFECPICKKQIIITTATSFFSATIINNEKIEKLEMD